MENPRGLNKNGIGNCGFSLRSKSIMIECIDKIKPFKSGYIRSPWVTRCIFLKVDDR